MKAIFFIWFSKHVLFFWSSAQEDKVIPYSRPKRPVVTFFLNCEKINCNPLIEKASRSLSVSWDVNKKMSLGVKKLVRLLPFGSYRVLQKKCKMELQLVICYWIYYSHIHTFTEIHSSLDFGYSTSYIFTQEFCYFLLGTMQQIQHTQITPLGNHWRFMRNAGRSFSSLVSKQASE